jgi:hypothetical protein
MPNDPLANHFKQVRNLGRTATPQAWAFDNADLFANGLPIILTLLAQYEITLRRITVIDDMEWMKEMASNALNKRSMLQKETIEKLTGII